MSQITTAVAETTVAAGMPVWRRYIRRLTKAGPDRGGAYTNTSETRVKRHGSVIASIKGCGHNSRVSSGVHHRSGQFTVHHSSWRVHQFVTSSSSSTGYAVRHSKWGLRPPVLRPLWTLHLRPDHVLRLTGEKVYWVMGHHRGAHHLVEYVWGQW